MEIGVLFADVRGFTTLAESLQATEVNRLMNRFYSMATRTLLAHDAVIDKFVGDSVMALFTPYMLGDRLLRAMVDAGEALLREAGFGTNDPPWLALGVGMDLGTACVGNVGPGEVKDFTALGDVVNTAERLQGAASPGHMVLSERVYNAVRDRYPDGRRVELALRGKSALVAAWNVAIS